MIRQLTGIRAILAWWVVGLHLLCNDKTAAYFPFSAVFSRGYLAVDGFFVLSGFILCYAYGSKLKTFTLPAYRSYLLARLARIYPTHLLMLCAFIPVVIANRWLHHANHSTSFSLPDLGLSLLLVQAWGFVSHPVWNGIAWSISAEWFAYLLLPLFLMIVVRGGAAAKGWQLLAVTLACLCALHWVKLVLDKMGGTDGIYATALVRVSANFALGCVAYVLFSNLRPTRWLGTSAAIAAMFCATFHQDELFSLAFLMVVFALSSESDWLSLPLSSRQMVYLGEISFALYMVHLFAWELVETLAAKARLMQGFTVWMVVFVAAVVSLVASMVIYRFVEVPSRNYLRCGKSRGPVQELIQSSN